MNPAFPFDRISVVDPYNFDTDPDPCNFDPINCPDPDPSVSVAFAQTRIRLYPDYLPGSGSVSNVLDPDPGW